MTRSRASLAASKSGERSPGSTAQPTCTWRWTRRSTGSRRQPSSRTSQYQTVESPSLYTATAPTAPPAVCSSHSRSSARQISRPSPQPLRQPQRHQRPQSTRPPHRQQHQRQLHPAPTQPLHRLCQRHSPAAATATASGSLRTPATPTPTRTTAAACRPHRMSAWSTTRGGTRGWGYTRPSSSSRFKSTTPCRTTRGRAPGPTRSTSCAPSGITFH